LNLERINENCIFAYVPELEPIFAVMNLLQGEEAEKLCQEVYGEKEIVAWKKQYPFLFETSKAVQNIDPWGIMGFVIDMPLEKINLDYYKDYLLGIDQVDFLWRHLDLDYVDGAKKEDLQLALLDDEMLLRVFDWMEDRCESFLSFKAFIRETTRYIEDFFALAKKIQNSELKDLLKKYEDTVVSLKEEVVAGVNEVGGFEFSQRIMGKAFCNRGPYEEFLFVPSYMMPAKAVRFFHVKEEHKKQLLFMSVRKFDRNQEDVIKTLKVMGDGTRYQILALLAKEGTMRGMDIAKRVSVATSTISHHMELLKECGLITEEQVKNSKYYGLSRNGVAELIKDIQSDLKME